MSINRPGVAVTICVPRFKSAICSATPAPPYIAVDLFQCDILGQREKDDGMLEYIFNTLIRNATT